MSLSTFLNGRAPVTLRGLQMLALSDSASVQTRTSTSDSGGGATVSFVSGATIKCRIDPIGDRGEPREVGGRVDERSTHLVTVPAGTTVPSNGRIVITGKGTFEVTATRVRSAEWSKVFEVIQVL